MSGSGRRVTVTPIGALCVLLVALSAIYLPNVGHGFVKDDFVWIARSRLAAIGDAPRLAGAPTGFFRPLVSLSFAVNDAVCGLSPRCFGLTNFVLLLGSAAGVWLLARSLGLCAGAGLLTAAIWVFNWHGINMAVLWISGRTALILTLCATAGVASFVAGRRVLGVALVGCALLAKEEAVALPMLLVAWTVLDAILARDVSRLRRAMPALIVCALGAVGYAVLRAQSGAFTPATAPSYYHLDFSAGRLASNLAQYLDRSATFAAAVAVLFWLIGRPARIDWTRSRCRVMTFGLLWWIAGFSVTIFLPVRSSLYACMPSVGTALIIGTLVAAAAESVPEPRRVRATALGLMVPFLLWPVYWARNRVSVREADLSTRTMHTLQEVASRHAAGTVVILNDDRSHRPSLDHAFGTLLQEAADLMVRPPIVVWMEPPPADLVFAGLKAPTRRDVQLTLANGVLSEGPAGGTAP